MENNTNQTGGRSAGTQNRNRSRNRNRNRNRNNNSGGSQSRNRGGKGNNNRNRNRNRNRKPKVIELTLGQKILKAITFGAVDPNNKNKAKSTQGRQTKPQQKPQGEPAANIASSKQAKRKSKAREPRVYEVTSPRLYVGNLDYDAVESDLEDLFRGVGNVLTAEVVTNSRTQQSKGFAFVEMGSIEEAKRAVEVLHDQDFMGRKLLVSGAKSEGPRSGDGDSAEAA